MKLAKISAWILVCVAFIHLTRMYSINPSNVGLTQIFLFVPPIFALVALQDEQGRTVVELARVLIFMLILLTVSAIAMQFYYGVFELLPIAVFIFGGAIPGIFVLRGLSGIRRPSPKSAIEAQHPDPNVKSPWHK